MKIKKLRLILVNLFFLTAFYASHAWSHDLWVSMEKYRIEKAATPTIVIFSSHRFPAPVGDYIKSERLEKAFILTPSGRQFAATVKSDGTYDSSAAMTEEGTCLAVSLPVNGFSTKTTEGYQQGKNKKQVSNAIECRDSKKFAKAVFTVGKPAGELFSKPLGHAMEIIPQKDPALIKVGEVLPVLVLLEGKPAKTNVFGTYSSFSENPSTFAYTTATNKEGIAEIKMIHNGVWLLLVKQEESYPNADECDKRTWAATLTFEIQ
jgi:uncharacterized GH25 family protein